MFLVSENENIPGTVCFIYRFRFGAHSTAFNRCICHEERTLVYRKRWIVYRQRDRLFARYIKPRILISQLAIKNESINMIPCSISCHVIFVWYICSAFVFGRRCEDNGAFSSGVLVHPLLPNRLTPGYRKKPVQTYGCIVGHRYCLLLCC